MNYKDINDYELIYLISDNNENYKNVLFEKYEPIIKKICYTYHNQYNFDIDDLYEEAFLGYVEACNTFNSDNNTLFYTYVINCVRKKLIDYIRKLNNNKSKINRNVISLDTVVMEDFTINDYIEDDCDVFDTITEFELDESINNFKNDLKNIDSMIFELKYNNFSVEEISILLDISISKVRYRLQIIKSKLKVCNF